MQTVGEPVRIVSVGEATRSPTRAACAQFAPPLIAMELPSRLTSLDARRRRAPATVSVRFAPTVTFSLVSTLSVRLPWIVIVLVTGDRRAPIATDG
jgi:hypothetical protein